MSAIYYAGIGSRKTPLHILERFKEIGTLLAKEGCILRSGRAVGADSYFERGCRSVMGDCEIYVPWVGFPRDGELSEYPAISFYELSDIMQERARASVNTYHPAPYRLSAGARLLMARNYFQIYGDSTTAQKTDFIVCYTPDGKASGGTGQALRMAEHENIPIFNAHDHENDMGWFIGDIMEYVHRLYKNGGHV